MLKTRFLLGALILSLGTLLAGLSLSQQYPFLILLGVWGIVLGGFEIWQWSSQRQTLSSEFSRRLNLLTGLGLVGSMLFLALHLMGVF